MAIEEEWGLISLNTHKANDMAEFLIQEKALPGLESWSLQRREIKVGHSRFDFLLKRGEEQLFLEVKSCTLYSRLATQFPDAITARGRRHLEELTQMAKAGQKTGALFLGQNPHTRYFLPDWHTDLDFAQSLLQARGSVEFYPVAIQLHRKTGELSGAAQALEIPWEILQKEANDEGCYLYLLRLEEQKRIAVGRLGLIDFAPGFYVYCGSAKKNLTARLARHQRKKKKTHWHIDFLRAEAEHHHALAIRRQADLECALAQGIATLAEGAITNFGSSDCPCHSHLFYFTQNPLHQPSFHRLLGDLRMDQLLEE